ncbi:MAG: DUF3500 domain-containing protein [Planctomycetia bacterium]|nr:DUF3500 domain-containing protein [Planctomycetia bacterium]
MKLTRLILSLLALAVLTGVAYVNQVTETSGTKMAAAAEKFLSTLSAEQKARATFGFDDKERLNWHFIPLEKDKKSTRKGLPLEDMSKEQKEAALEILRAGAGAEGFTKATTIMALEGILLEAEKGSGPTRNPNWYFFTVFGAPSKTGQWGWRVEGHHLSLNFTMDKGAVVSATPAFFGANPALVQNGDKKGLRPLPEAEAPVKELFDALTDDQKTVAVQAKGFPEAGAKTTQHKGEPVGLPGEKMNDKQKGLLFKVIEGYAQRMAPDVAAAQIAEVKQAGLDKVYFALSGTPGQQGKGYTYRVQGPTFIIEFLNEQADGFKNPANHIHSSLRNLKGDFGLSAGK